jgi:hypothetical protein
MSPAWKVLLICCLFSVSVLAKDEQVTTLKVLSATTESTPISGEKNDVPADCNQVEYSAYCLHSRTAVVRYRMVVQDKEGKSYTISCTVDSRWSKCAPLSEGRTYNGQLDKRAMTVWYENSKGKVVKQTYAIEGEQDHRTMANATASPAPSSSQPASASASSPAESTVKINFSSTPAGADIIVDGKYVGNTPSTINMNPGVHGVTLALNGYEIWKRDLAVVAGSEVNVNGTLAKAQP